MLSTKEIGDWGERVAASFLESRGFRVLERQYRFERAEVDIVCFEPAADNDGGEIVFVEVKVRSGHAYGRPEEHVSLAKQRKIVKAASAFLHEHRLESAACRFDVVSILGRHDHPQIEHFRNAFLAD